MRPDDAKELDRHLDRVESWLSPRPARVLRWLRRPAARYVRVPLAILLVLGGVLSILPVLGLWMLPLGLVLLAHDVAPIRRPTVRLLGWIERTGRTDRWRPGKAKPPRPRVRALPPGRD